MLSSKFLKSLLVLLSFSITLNCQSQAGNINPSLFESIEITVNKIAIPKHLEEYAGIRFVDVRYLKQSVGFIPSFNGKQFFKLKTRLSLEGELNNAPKQEFKGISADSIIVVIKNCWINQIKKPELQSYCHLSALFFIRRNDSVYFDYKIDTFLNHKIPARDIYKTILTNSVDAMLSAYPRSSKYSEKSYSCQSFYNNLQSKRPTPATNTDSVGIFLSYGDFLKGKIFKTDFIVNPFFGQFYFRLLDEKLQAKLHDSLWGLLYKGETYIRNGNLLSKAFPVENSFLVQADLEIDGVSYGDNRPPYQAPYRQTYNGDPTSALQTGTYIGSEALIELLRKKKSKIKFYPMLLNIETGKLE